MVRRERLCVLLCWLTVRANASADRILINERDGALMKRRQSEMTDVAWGGAYTRLCA